MSKTVVADVVVMGSGVAGMGAAYKLANAGGLKVAVFEKYPAQGGAVSNCPMCFCSTPDTQEAQKSAFEVLARFSNYTANMGLISNVVKYSSEFPRIFLEEYKIEAPMVVKRDPKEYGTQRGYTMGHANGLDVGDVYFINGRGQGHGMALALLRMRFDLEKKGVDFYFQTPIKEIVQDESGKVIGAVAHDKDGERIDIQCKALIVASGGISADLEMMKAEGIVHTKFEDAFKEGTLVIKTFGDSCQDGDGQKAVWAIGGKKGGFAISADPEIPNPGIRLGTDIAWFAANQIKIVVEQPYLRVNENGKRFINEEMSNQHTAMSAAYDRQPNQCGYMLMDEDTAKALEEAVDERYIYFIFKGMTIKGLRAQMDGAIAMGNKHICHFDTIHEVAEFMGINEAELKKTIANYNAACEAGYDPEMKTDPTCMRPVREESGHIYCFRIFPGAYNTMGGLLIDENANILDVNDRPIQGLYGAGDMVTGSLYGNPPVNAGGTVFGSMPTGLLAGVSAAAYVKGEC